MDRFFCRMFRPQYGLSTGLSQRDGLRVVAVLAAVLCFSMLTVGQTNDSWTGSGGNVFWSTSGNWSAGVPNGNYNVFIDNGSSAASAVTLDISPSISNLTIDSDDALSFNNGTSLTVSGGMITNAGRISINGGNAVNAILALSANTTL